MPNRIVNRRRLKKYGIGDLRDRITIHTRVITPPSFNSVNITETYDAGVKYWASIETLDKKKQMFSGVNIPDAATHSFTIRYDASITAENVISFENEYYDILKTADPDKRKQYTELFSKLKGDDTLSANQ